MISAKISAEYIDHMGSDASVVRAARVSFAGDSKEFDVIKDAKLINYLAKNGHTSPFNHTFITVKVKAPVFCSRQLVKHKFMPWNEESRRYINTEPEFYFPDVYRGVAESVKQGSSDEDVSDVTIPYVYDNCSVKSAVVYHAQESLSLYNNLIEAGVCNEQARMVLPQNMMVNWYWSGTLGAFTDMLNLRLDPHTQKESQDVAKQIKDVVEKLFPISLKALVGDI